MISLIRSELLNNEKRYYKSFLSVLIEDESKEEVDDEEKKEKNETETSLANLRRKNFLTIMSCVDFEEARHKPLKIKLEADQEME